MRSLDEAVLNAADAQDEGLANLASSLVLILKRRYSTLREAQTNIVC
jgi:hypothetical protein